MIKDKQREIERQRQIDSLQLSKEDIELYERWIEQKREDDRQRFWDKIYSHYEMEN